MKTRLLAFSLIFFTLTLIVIPIPSVAAALNIDYIGSYWSTHVAYDGSESLSLNIVLVSYEKDTIRNLYAEAHLFEGAYFKDMSETAKIYYNTPISYGEMFTLTFPNIYLKNVKPGLYTVKVDVIALVSSGAGLATKTTTVYATVQVSQYISTLKIISLEWIYNGEHVVALPGSSNIVLRAKIYNERDYSIGSIVVNASFPSGITLVSQGGTCTGELGPGKTCNLDLYLNISRQLAPRQYNATLTFTYQLRDGSSLHLVKDIFIIPINITNPNLIDTELDVVSIFWGSERVPQAAYPASKNIPLTINLVNNGEYDVSNVMLSVVEVPKGIKPVYNSTICAITLPSLSQCSGQLFFDIEPFVKPGLYNVTLNLTYYLASSGTILVKNKVFTVNVSVEEYAGRGKEGLLIVDYGWQNDWPVYPNTEKAIFTITLANRLPYAISGIIVNMSLPHGFTDNEGRNHVTTYISGPISSEQTFTAQFKLNVGNVTPETYLSNITVSYIVETGRSKYMITEHYRVKLNIVESGEIEYVTSFWIEGSSGPGDYGKTLYVLFRNNNVPLMKGIIGEFILPEGFIVTLTNSSKALLTPTTTGSLQEILAVTPENMRKLITTAIIGGVAPAETQNVEEGSFIVFGIPLGISKDVKPGIYDGVVILNFIDQWGNIRRFRETFKIPVFGSLRLLKIIPQAIQVEVKGTNTTFTVRLENIGSAKLENVYAVAYSTTPYIIIGDPVKYVGALEAGEARNLTYTIFFNPALPQNMPLGGSVPVILTLTFRDPQGIMRSFNQTVAIVLTPTVDLRIFDVSYEPIESGIRVSGIIANLGASVARNVELEVYVGNASGYSLIGDMDPSTQMSFSVDVPFKGNASKVIFSIKYKDFFYADKVFEEIVPLEIVSIVRVTATTPAPTQGLIDVYRIAVIVLVGAFLATIAIILRSYVKRRWRT